MVHYLAYTSKTDFSFLVSMKKPLHVTRCPTTRSVERDMFLRREMAASSIASSKPNSPAPVDIVGELRWHL